MSGDNCVKKIKTHIKKHSPAVTVQNKFATLHASNAIVQWCNGSTSDSGSACEGSSPSWTTEIKKANCFQLAFLVLPFIYLITKQNLTLLGIDNDRA